MSPRQLPAAATLAASFLACSPPPEEALIGQFLRALAQEDRTTASGVSMAPFPGGPPGAGLLSWEVLEIGEEIQGPYRVPELREEETAAKRRRDDQFKVFYDFRQGNREALDQIVARREGNPEVRIGGRLGGIAAEFDAHRGERRRMVSSLSELQMALDEERRRAQRSLLREAPVDYLTGNILEKEVLVRAALEEGVSDYRFSLIRYDLRNQFDREVPSRWIIAAIEALAPSAPPAS